jgi:tetratricopeptide (TPR) repeat protein
MKHPSKAILAAATLLTFYSAPSWAESALQAAQLNTQEEISRLKKNIEDNYRDIKSINDLGVFQLKLGHSDKAITQLKKALEIGPSYTMGPLFFGDIYTDAKNYQDKINEFQEIIKTNREYARAHNYLGLAYLQQKNYPIAKLSLFESIKINPKYAKAHNNLGVLYEDIGETAKAIESYKMASRIDPNDPDSFYNLGLAYDSLDDGENSVRHMVLAKKTHERKLGSKGIDRISDKLDQLWAKYSNTTTNTSVASLGSDLTSDFDSPTRISSNQTAITSSRPLLTPLGLSQTSNNKSSSIAYEGPKELAVTLKPHWGVSGEPNDLAAKTSESNIEEESFSKNPIKEVKTEKGDDSKIITALHDKNELTVKANIMDKTFTGSQGTYAHPGSSSKSGEKTKTTSSPEVKKKLIAQKPNKKTWVSDWVFEYPK